MSPAIAASSQQASIATVPAPFTVRVESAVPSLPYQVAKALAAAGFATEAKKCAADTCSLQYRAAPPPAQVTQLIAHLIPFNLKPTHAPGLDVDAVVTLGDLAVSTYDWNVRVQAETAEFASDVAAACSSYGYKTQIGMELDFLAEPELHCGAVPGFLRAMIGWTVLQGCGVVPRQVQNRSLSKDRIISLRLPVRDVCTVPLRARVPLIVRADDPAAFAAIVPLLCEANFTRIELKQLETVEKTRFRITPGPLAASGAHIEMADLTRALAAAGEQLGIDWGRFPIEMDREPNRTAVTIDLPIAAAKKGYLKPWSKFEPSSCKIKVMADDRPIRSEITEALKAAGFRAVRAELPSAENGFVVRCKSDVPEIHKAKVLALIEAELLRLGAASESLPGFDVLDSVGESAFSIPELDLVDSEGESAFNIEVELPVRAMREGKLSEILASATRHSITITAPTEEVAEPLATAIRAWSPRRVHVVVDTDDDPAEIQYGSARPALLDRIQAEIEHHYGPISLPRQKSWDNSDHDIFIRLPLSVMKPRAVDIPVRRELPRIGAVPQVSNLRHHGPLVQIDGSELRIGQLRLPRNQGPAHPRALSPDRFHGFCIDQQVAETLHFLALAIQGGHPAALEGATAVSKTHAIHYLAAMLGVGVYRQNLSAHSDVSDLLGRFVPDTERAGAFRYQFGPAPLAMMEGAWMVLDETDLAPADVIEVLNPLLETPDPRLVLSSFDGRVIRAQKGFRVLATWNGASYSGRQEMSPAFLDRFKIRVCTPPTEADYLALAHCLVFGRQPEVVIGGARYGGDTTTAALPELAHLLPDCDRYLQALASFQAGMTRMAAAGELRASGPVAYTRRAFVDVLGTLRNLLANGDGRASSEAAIRCSWQALSLCHLERLPPDQRAKAVEFLELCGIGENAWELPT